MLEAFVLVAGIEAAVFLATGAVAIYNRRLVKEMHQVNVDLGVALGLAAQGRYTEAHAASRRFVNRMEGWKKEREGKVWFRRADGTWHTGGLFTWLFNVHDS
jgi:hypothetical protein